MHGFNFSVDQVDKLLNDRPSGFLLDFNYLVTFMSATTLREFMKKHERYILSFKLAYSLYDDEQGNDEDLFRKVFFPPESMRKKGRKQE